ncbi:MAG: SCO family protein [Myxococcota bacterium]
MPWLIAFATGCGTPPAEPLPYYATRDFTPHWYTPATVPDDFHRIPAFSLTDQHGETVTEAELAGRVTIASFFFTRCGGVCPKLTASLEKVDAALDSPSIPTPSSTPRTWWSSMGSGTSGASTTA